VTWSPNGQNIAYVVWNADQNRKTWTVQVDGSQVKQVSDSSSDSGWVNWGSLAPIPPTVPEAAEIAGGTDARGCPNGRGIPPPPCVDINAPVKTYITDPTAFTWECNNKVLNRLSLNIRVQTTDGGGTQINVRQEPDVDSERIRQFGPSVTGTIVEGPVCNNFIWYEIQFEDSTVGWVAEGGGIYYYLEPLR
jgi:hypothetical protein